jgi:hypothetical protein
MVGVAVLLLCTDMMKKATKSGILAAKVNRTYEFP